MPPSPGTARNLACPRLRFELDDGDDCVALGFEKDDDVAVVLGPVGKPTDESGPLLHSSKLAKARDLLNSRGIATTELREDRQGTHFFEMRDLEGNVIEVCEMP
jgi:hypothetical protein